MISAEFIIGSIILGTALVILIDIMKEKAKEDIMNEEE